MKYTIKRFLKCCVSMTLVKGPFPNANFMLLGTTIYTTSFYMEGKKET